MGCKEHFAGRKNLPQVPAHCQESSSSVQGPTLLFAKFLSRNGSLGAPLHSIKLFGEGECRVDWEGMKSWASGECVFPSG